MKKLLHHIINAVFPKRCYSCKTIISHASSLCPKCFKDLSHITKPYCNICGAPFEFEDEDFQTGKNRTCGKCIKTPPHFDKAKAVYIYNDMSKNLILPFKHGDKTQIAHFLAKQLDSTGKTSFKNADLIIPVPLHKDRFKKRKYNQAGILASNLSKISKIPVNHFILERIKATKSQGHLTTKQRLKNITGAFKVNPKLKHLIKDKNIILIDDVITTSSTINECAKVLKKSGAKKIEVLAIAKTSILK